MFPVSFPQAGQGEPSPLLLFPPTVMMVGPAAGGGGGGGGAYIGATGITGATGAMGAIMGAPYIGDLLIMNVI